MDNKAYLDQIAVKGKRHLVSGPILSPTILKLLIVAIIAIISLFIVGAVISSTNTQLSDNYARLFTRIKNFTENDGPLNTYGEELKSSDLRAHALTLSSSLTSTLNSLGGIANNLGVDPDNPPSSVQDSEAELLGAFNSTLYSAQLNGQLDRSFASETAYQISLLLSLESEIREKSSNSNLAPILDSSINDLTSLQKNFTDYSNSH